jgi:Zn-dependent protease/CBS domain-containing protein
MDLTTGLLIARIRGIAIRLHWSWLVIFGVVVWNYQSGLLPAELPGWNSTQLWVGGVAAALVFFASLLLHELAHAFVALHYGMKVSSITLFILGGVSNIEGEMPSPKQEFRVAIAGPATSLLIGVVLGAISWVLPAGGVGTIVAYLAFTNVALAVFNLVPGFPLDGGRVFRSIVWAATGDLVRSTRVAARAGTMVAWGLIALGIYLSIATRSLTGISFVLIGLFLKTASDSAYGQMLLERTLEGIFVRDVMREAPAPVDRATNLKTIVEERVIGRGERSIFVGSEGTVLGLFTIADLAAIPQDELVSKTAGEIMIPAERVVTVLPGTPLLEATRAMTERDIHQVPVVEDGRMVGVLSRGDVLQQLEVRQRFGRLGGSR